MMQSENPLTRLPSNRAIRLPNETCPYCGCGLDQSSRTKEHVVGRGFVPSGTLDAQWNLIFWACEPCNRRKADLEDDLSAITMQPNIDGTFAVSDLRLRVSAERKARRSFSRRTKKPIGDSREDIEIKGRFGPATMTFNFTSPAQADPVRIRELARLHAMGFFYFITFNAEERRGRFWRGSFMPIDEANRLDWGNDVQVAFAEKVADWEPRIFGGSADGFFKVAIRKCPTREMWSVAFEWNCQLRVVAAFGDVAALDEFGSSLPRLDMQLLAQDGDDWLRYREEIPLHVGDQLFVWENEKLGSPD